MKSTLLMILLLFGGSLLYAVFFMRGIPQASEDRIAGNAASPSPQLITELRFRDHLISIYAGRRYTVRSLGGEVLAELVGEQDLRSAFPEIHDSLKTMVADVHATTGPSPYTLSRPDAPNPLLKTPDEK